MHEGLTAERGNSLSVPKRDTLERQFQQIDRCSRSRIHNKTGLPDGLVLIESTGFGRGEDKTKCLLRSEQLEPEHMLSEEREGRFENLLRREGTGAYVHVQNIRCWGSRSGTLHTGIVGVFDEWLSPSQLRTRESRRHRTGALSGTSACSLGEGPSQLRGRGGLLSATRNCTGVAGAHQRGRRLSSWRVSADAGALGTNTGKKRHHRGRHDDESVWRSKHEKKQATNEKDNRNKENEVRRAKLNRRAEQS
jgi:hypothetical protein